MSAYELNVSISKYDSSLIFQMTLSSHNPFSVIDAFEAHLQVLRANLEATYQAEKKSEAVLDVDSK
jgi:hypothetical protein